MAYERVCALDEVSADQGLAVTIGDLDVVIARDGDEVFAVEDTCSHAYVPLSEGDVEGCTRPISECRASAEERGDEPRRPVGDASARGSGGR